MEGAAKGVHLENLEAFEDLAKRLIQKGNPSTDMIALAGTSACELAMKASANAAVVDTCEALLKSLGALEQAKSPDWAATLGTAMVSAVGRAMMGCNGDRSDDNRVMHAQTPGASASNLCDVVGFALRLGANPNALTQDKQQDTALNMLLRYPSTHRVLPNDRAAGEAISRTVQALLKHGANLNIGNRKGERPVPIAKQLLDMGERYGQAWLQLVQKEPLAPSQQLLQKETPACTAPQSPDSAKPRSPEGLKTLLRLKSPASIGRPKGMLQSQSPSQIGLLPTLSPSQAQVTRQRSLCLLRSSLSGGSSLSGSGHDLGSSRSSLSVLSGGAGGGNIGAGHGARTPSSHQRLPALLPNLAGSTSPAGLMKRSLILRQV